MRKAFLSGWIFSLILVQQLAAQINESDTVKFQQRLAVTGLYQTGNVELLTVRTKLDASFSPSKKWVIKTQNNSLYQAFGTVKADNDVYSRNYLYYQPTRKFYPFVIAYLSSNYRRKVDVRSFAGVGLTYQLKHRTNTLIKVSVNTVYESTKFSGTIFNQTKYNGSNIIQLWRATLYSGGWQYVAQRKVKLYYDVFYQPAFNNLSNYRVQLEAGAEVQVWKGFALNALYTLTHENVVLQNIKLQDRILTFGLVYQFKIK